MTFADLRALHTILGDAIDDIQRIYASEQVDVFADNVSQTTSSLYASPPPSPSASEFPLDFPSIDQPYNPYDPAEQLTAHPIVVTSINRIIAAAGQMAVMVQWPFYALCDAAMGYHLPSCLRLLEASHTVEILREAGPEGLHVDLISERNGVESEKLAHVLRLLATHHLIRECAPNIFTLNRISSLIDSGKSHEQLKRWESERRLEMKYRNTDGIGAFVGLSTDELFKSSAYLTEAYLLSHKNPLRTPFEHAFGTDVGFFAWLEGEESREQHRVAKKRDDASGEGETGKEDLNWNQFRLERFGTAMSGTGSWEAPGAVFNGFDWRTLPRGSVIVDVGGGIGSTSMLLANAFSRPSMGDSADGPEHLYESKRTEDRGLGFKFVIQDREVVVGMGETTWRNKCPEFLDAGTVEFQVHDFFTDQPIRNAAVFLLRVILHDWPNAQARTILLKLREAAMRETKLVLADFVLPLACVDDGDDSDALEDVEGAKAMLAPLPLLANLGKASANAYWMDMTMQVTFNAQERTLREIRALALSAGWKVIKVTHAPGSLFGHIVAVPVTIPTQRRARAGSGSTLPKVYVNNKVSRPVGDVGENLKDDTDVTVQRTSSRCGTPTFGSRSILPSVQERMSRFGGVRSKVSRLAEKFKRPGILKQSAVITTSTATTSGKKKPSPLSLSSPARTSADSSLGSPRHSQPSSPITRKFSYMQLRPQRPVSPTQRQVPPSPLSPKYPHSQLQHLLSGRGSHVQLSNPNLAESTTVDLPPSPSIPSHYILQHRVLARTASHANLSRRSDSQSTTTSTASTPPLSPSPQPKTSPRLPRLRTLSRSVSFAQLSWPGHGPPSQPPVPSLIPIRQPEGMTTQNYAAPPMSPRPLPPCTGAPIASGSSLPREPTVRRRLSLAQLRPPQVTLRKRSGTLVGLPISSNGMDVSVSAHSSGAALDSQDGYDEGPDREVEFEYGQGCDRGGGGSVLAAAAEIDQRGYFKARFSNQ